MQSSIVPNTWANQMSVKITSVPVYQIVCSYLSGKRVGLFQEGRSSFNANSRCFTFQHMWPRWPTVKPDVQNVLTDDHIIQLQIVLRNKPKYSNCRNLLSNASTELSTDWHRIRKYQKEERKWYFKFWSQSSLEISSVHQVCTKELCTGRASTTLSKVLTNNFQLPHS